MWITEPNNYFKNNKTAIYIQHQTIITRSQYAHVHGNHIRIIANKKEPFFTMFKPAVLVASISKKVIKCVFQIIIVWHGYATKSKENPSQQNNFKHVLFML